MVIYAIFSLYQASHYLVSLFPVPYLEIYRELRVAPEAELYTLIFFHSSTFEISEI